ncbi:MAG: acyl-[acyl-carrier-protein] thioesterase [Chloroflexota bacterium]
MAAVYTTTFPVRNYECDPFNEVSHASYLRYMQEAAFGASADVGFSAGRYRELGLTWLAYETNIEYRHQLTYGETVRIKTWVADFRRVRSLRRYELYSGDKLTATATTDWVLIDNAKRMPTTVPDFVVDAYSDGQQVETVERVSPLPAAPAPKQGAFQHTLRVTWRDLDPAGHVNNAIYLDFIADSQRLVNQHYGWTRERLGSMGLKRRVRQHVVAYKTPAMLDDELAIQTWLSHVEGNSAIRHYHITRHADGKLIATVRESAVWINPATGAPALLPDVYRADLAENIVVTGQPSE